MKEKLYYVYCHINKINGKKYFGITCQKPKDRWDSGHGYRNNIYFWNAIKKNGWNGFKHIIIFEGLQKEVAKMIEIELIAKYNTRNRELGYNITAGGESGNEIILSEEARNKIADAHRGVVFSKERRDKISKALKGKKGKSGRDSPNYGRKWTEEQREKLRISNSGKNHRLYGKHQSEETKKRISDTESIPIIQFDLHGNIIKKWNGLAETELDGFLSSKISNCCKNKRLTHGEYVWMYEKDYDNMNKQQIKEKFDKINEILNKYNPKKIVQLTIDYKFIKEWNSSTETSKFGFNKGCVSNCCIGRTKTHKNYIWMFKKDYDNKKEEFK